MPPSAFKILKHHIEYRPQKSNMSDDVGIVSNVNLICSNGHLY